MKNIESEIALYENILCYGSSCLVQASMETGYGITVLRKACNNLVTSGLIKSVNSRIDIDQDCISFEPVY